MSLIVDHLEKYRPGFVIRANFQVSPGEILALKGRSGCGKTTILRMLAGFETTDKGSIFLGERNLTRLPPEKRKLGVVPQNPSLFLHLDMTDNVTFGLKARGLNRTDREKIADDLLRAVNLQHLKTSAAANLSGGEQRRIALLRAIAWKPQALLLDEPFAGLDSISKVAMKQETSRFISDLKIPCLIITHDEQDLENLEARTIEVREDASQQTRIFESPIITG